MVKSAAKLAFQHGGGLALVRRLNRDGLRILMYHRFSDRAALARQCAHIRKHYHPVSMTDVAGWLAGTRKLPPYAVAVTIDDGYRDFQDAGHPVFAEYGIPVTVFLVTNFLDGKDWLWFDRVVYAYGREKGQRMADEAVSWSAADRARLAREIPVPLPAVPPEYQPLTWDTVRELARSGVEFGAHTKSHPILSSVLDPAELHDEIAGSKARIEAQLDQPVLHFCYPNGKMRDIGPAAVDAVCAAGMRTAVTAEPGLNQAGQDAFLLKRIGADPSHADLYFQRGLAGWRD